MEKCLFNNKQSFNVQTIGLSWKPGFERYQPRTGSDSTNWNSLVYVRWWFY